MKYHLFFTLLLATQIMSAQAQQTFIYELKLYDPYQSKLQWSDKEHSIQQSHIAYLQKLTEEGKLQLAGIKDQGLEGHEGFVILYTKDYEEAKSIAMNDPSVKEGMMSVRLRPVHLYCKGDKQP